MDLLSDDVNISGITSIAGDFNVGSSGTTFHVDTTRGLAGVGTNAPDFLLHAYGPASTGTTALYVRGDARITGDLVLDDLNLDSATFNFLNVSGCPPRLMLKSQGMLILLVSPHLMMLLLVT